MLGGGQGNSSNSYIITYYIIFFRLMVFSAWVLSFMLSIPQAMMFRKVKHPDMEFSQCTTDMVLEMHSDMVIQDGEISFLFFGINPHIIYSFYHFSFLFFVYFLPLLVILINFMVILNIIKR